MALLECNIFSRALDMSTQFLASLPNDFMKKPEGGFPAVYLLHGLSDDHTAWIRRTNVERYATDHGFAVIMPEVQRSFYCDMKYGSDYFTYVSDELPRFCRELFGLSSKREETFVAGLSMGGYGALKCALSRPDVFCAAASLSGAVNVKAYEKMEEGRLKDQIRGIVGTGCEVPERDDLFALARKAAELPPEKRPSVMTCCGTEDSLYGDNLLFRDLMRSLDMRYEYREGPGDHNWVYWDAMIQLALDFFGSCGKNPEA